ncbi:MAG TPA: hypothetical protein VFV86_04205 [Nitrososphaeraceae archaeon]|nr:hypothetical protein [Nitrososphaeraceae archaeon]
MFSILLFIVIPTKDPTNIAITAIFASITNGSLEIKIIQIIQGQ